MDFNVKKCKIMRITKKKQPFTTNFFLDNPVLEEVNKLRDSVGIAHYCRSNLHIDKVVPKANRMLRLIKRSRRNFDDRKNTENSLYCALVHSNLEYCSLIWSPYTKKNVEKLEKVQRRATKFILKTEDCYDSLLKKSNLLSPEKRRLLTDVTFL